MAGQRSMALNAGGNDRTAMAGRLPMKEEPPPPRDPDQPYLTLYLILASCLTSLPSPAAMKEWVGDNRAAFSALADGSPDRAARLREIYRLHLDCLRPHAVIAATTSPGVALPAADLVDTILSDAGLFGAGDG